MSGRLIVDLLHRAAVVDEPVGGVALASAGHAEVIVEIVLGSIAEALRRSLMAAMLVESGIANASNAIQ